MSGIMSAIVIGTFCTALALVAAEFCKYRNKKKNWKAHRLHKQAEMLMDKAFMAGMPITDYRNPGSRNMKSKLLYYQTALLEEQAALLTNHPLSKGVLYRSAAWCAIHAGMRRDARRFAQAGLAAKNVPGEIRDELTEALIAAQEPKCLT